MKILICTVVLVTTVFAAPKPKEFKKDLVIYEAAVNGKTIKVFLSESPFEPENHKITPGTVVIEGVRRDWPEGGIDSKDWPKGGFGSGHFPKVDGHEVVGYHELETSKLKGVRHLTRLAVSFDGHIVEAEPQLIAHVFLPSKRTTFHSEYRAGMISISSDTKAVVVDLAVGDGDSADHEAFTFSIAGDCRLGVPPPPAP